MDNNFLDKRKSGVSLVGDLNWGTSFCQLYQNPDELLEIVGPYLRTGLENNELCILVSGDETHRNDFKTSLLQSIPKVEEYLRNGQLEIISLRQWIPRGLKSEKSLMAKWDKCISRCFDGLRLAFAFSPNNARMVSISSSLDKVLSNFNAIAVYAYPRDSFDAVGLMEVVKNHQIAVTKNAGKWEAIKSSEARIAQNALNRSEEKLRLLFNHMAEGFAYHRIILDERGKPCDYVFLEVNQAFEKLVGLKAKEVIGQRVTRALPGIEKDPVNWIEKYGQVALTGKPNQFESYSADLSRWYQVSAFSSQKGFFSVIFTDITDRKTEESRKQKLLKKEQNLAEELEASNEELRATTEELQASIEELRQQTEELSRINLALQESEQRFSVAFQSSPAALFISSFDDDSFIDVNQSFEGLFGYDRKDLIGHRLASLYNNPDERVNMVRNLRENGLVSNHEVKARTKKGKEIIILVSAAATVINGKKSILWTSLDITERKKAEETVHRHQAEIQTLFENILAGLVLFDAASPYRVLVHNKYYQELFPEPFRSRGMTGLNVDQYAPEVEASGVISVFDEVVRTKQSKSFLDFPYNANPAKESWFNWYIAPIIVDDKVVALVSMSLDITERHLAESALKESEERFNRVFRSSPAAKAITRVNDGTFVDINDNYERLMGYTRQEVLGRKTTDFNIYLHPEQRIEIIRQVNEQGSVRNKEITFRKKDGQLIDTLCSLEVINVQGQNYFLSALIDITERKKAEEALKESQEKYRSIIESMDEALALCEAVRDTGGCMVDYRWLEVNSAQEKLTHLSRSEMVGKLRSESPLRPDPEAMQLFKNVMEKGQPIHVERYWPANDSWVQFGCFPIGKNRFVTFGFDITGQKKAQAALQESEERFRSVLNNSLDVIYRFNLQTGRYEYMSPAIRRMGFDPEEMTAMTNEEVLSRVHPDDLAELKRGLALLAEKGVGYSEYRFLGKDGIYRWWSNQLIITNDKNGKPLYRDGYVRDISERKKAEEELKLYATNLETANKELETFSYSVSHDLRSPLRTLDGFSEMILEEYSDKLGEDGKDYLNRIRKASHTMSELIDSILKLSRISRSEMRQDKVDLTDLAKSIAEVLKFNQPERKAEFLIEPDLVVDGDVVLLRIVLNNLLENAWKYTGRCPQTRIEIGKINQSGEKVYFIKDNGIGFDMKYKDKLFQPFQRLHQSNEYPGIGIGLATVQRVIRRHNGRIWAESEAGKGTTFYFTLG